MRSYVQEVRMVRAGNALALFATLYAAVVLMRLAG
jgi:hypothetical protein